MVWSPCCTRGFKESSPAPQFKIISFSLLSLLYGQPLTSIISTGKTLALTIQTFVNKVMPLLCNVLSRFVIAFLPRSKYLSIYWLQSTSRVVFLALENKSLFPFSPPMCHEEMGLDGVIFGFSMLSFKQAFSLSFFRRLLSQRQRTICYS